MKTNRKLLSVLTILFLLGFSLAGCGKPVSVEKTTGERIWQSYLGDSRTQAISDADKEIIKPYVMAIPDTLKNMMDEAATAQSVIKSQCLIIKNMLDSGFIESMVKTLPTEQVESFGGKEEMIKMMKNRVQTAIDQTEELIPSITELMAQQGLTEEQFFRQMGMNEENLTKLEKNELTISDIVFTQPYILLPKN